MLLLLTITTNNNKKIWETLTITIIAGGSIFHLLLKITAAVFLLTNPTNAGENAHDFAFRSIEGDALPMSAFKGKTVLVVNTGSLCGFTPQ